MIDSLELLMKSEIKLSDDITIKIPTVEDIIQVGEKNHNRYTHIIASTPYDYMIELNAEGKDYERTSSLELLQRMARGRNKDVDSAFVYYTGYHLRINENKKEIPDFYLEDIKTGKVLQLTEGLMFLIRGAVSDINVIHKEEKTFGNERAKKYYIKQMTKRAEREKKEDKKPTIDIASMISLLHWQSGIPYPVLRKYTIYRIIEGYYRLELIDEFNQRKTALYGGTMNPKEVKLVSWAKSVYNKSKL